MNRYKPLQTVTNRYKPLQTIYTLNRYKPLNYNSHCDKVSTVITRLCRNCTNGYPIVSDW